MPSRNVLKLYVADTYYHVYNRGVAKQDVFCGKDDYSVFFNLLKRYLDETPAKDNLAREYPWLRGKVELLAFCLMPNHFHLFFYVKDPSALEKIMRGICTSYAMYFNKKYQRVGPIFQGVYRATNITSDDYLLHITRYIHMNPVDYRSWQPSSLRAYLGKQELTWLQPEKILGLFNDRTEYDNFLADYKDYKSSLDEVKALLASE